MKWDVFREWRTDRVPGDDYRDRGSRKWAWKVASAIHGIEIY